MYHRRDVQHRLPSADYAFLVHEDIDTLGEARQRLQQWDELSRVHPRGQTARLAGTITDIVERWEALLPKNLDEQLEEAIIHLANIDDRIDSLYAEKLSAKMRLNDIQHQLNLREMERERIDLTRLEIAS